MISLLEIVNSSQQFRLLLAFAEHAREEFESSLVSTSKKSQGYSIGRAAKKLPGRCHLASRRLYELAKEEGISVNFCYGFFDYDPNEKTDDLQNWHCWIEFDNKIIDITATQFDDLPKVYVTDSSNNRYKKTKCQKYTKPKGKWAGGWASEDYWFDKEGRLCTKSECF